LNPEVQEIVRPADVVIMQRNLLSQSVWNFCDYWRGMGKLVLSDLDDAYQIMPQSNPAYPFWHENKGNLPEEPIKILTTGLSHTDGLLAPNRVLLDDWKHVVPGYFLPNYATGAWYRDLPKRERGDELVIGWGGSVSHYDSWWGSGIREALNAICAEFPHVKVKICGNDKRIFDQLPVPASQKIHQPGVPPEEWPKQVASFDIGVAPLFGPYDQRRSWIKALEYLLVGIPWVGAAGEPYSDFKEYGALVEEGINNWHKALREVVVHYDDYLERAQANRAVGWEYTLERAIEDGRYEKLFRTIHKRGTILPNIAYVNWRQVGAATASPDAVAEKVA